jgi:hypothetical protein
MIGVLGMGIRQGFNRNGVGETDSESINETGLLVINTTFFSSNDDVAHAIPIESLPYTHSQNTDHTTLEFDELISKCGLRESTSVWYQYTPNANQQVSVSTEGSDYDTVLSIWTGKKTHPLTELDCNDDAITGEEGEQASQISLPLTAGNTYFIKVSSSPEKTGNLVLQVAPIVNDISIIEQPIEQTIAYGEKAILTVKISGTEPFSYQWYQGKKGDVSIPRVNVKMFTTKSLTETNHYWVRVTNPTGRIDSQTTTITVREKITNGVRIDTEGNEIPTQTNFVGSVTTSADEKESVKVVSQTDTIFITFTITVDPNHADQVADVLIVGQFRGNNINQFYLRDGNQKSWKIWDGKMSHLVPAETAIQLSDRFKVEVFEGYLERGLFTVYVGYRLKSNGHIFYNGEPINLTVE